MIKEVTRYIKSDIERELWGRSSGRCQFEGCNKLLYKSSVTQETVNIAQKAHIYAFSEKGPRGWSDDIKNGNQEALNDIDNLMLMCHECHNKIDRNEHKYPASLLIKWKFSHEKRIEIVTGIEDTKKSHVIFFGANISSQSSRIKKNDAFKAMFPNKYPSSDRPINFSLDSEIKDDDENFWQLHNSHITKKFDRLISPIIEDDEVKSFSLFALAPIPLLIKIGSLFTDKIDIETYQLKREPQSWIWENEPEGFEFILNNNDNFDKDPVLIFSLSGKISHNRITNILGDVNIWEITIPNEFLHNDFIRAKSQLSQFRTIVRKVLVEINQKHPNKYLSIFPAMPISCAVELGRIRMPKSDAPWIIYDQNNNLGEFIKTITIGEHNE